MFDYKIAIIGAGVSGLFTAYEIAEANLARSIPKKIKIDIYEKSNKQGGNAQTVVFSLGRNKGLPQDISHGGEYVRWADLGVNDINLTAYTNVAKVMKKIGYHDENWPKKDKNLLPLENTETYFALDGTIALTDDEDLKQGVIDPQHSLADIEDGTLPKWIKVIYKAAFDEIADEERSLTTTCADFFDRCIDSPKENLEGAQKQVYKHENWPWDDKNWIKTSQGRLRLLRDCVFYPRISAMYFANESGPENMLLAAPFKYYKIQESADGETPKRRYFVHGAQTWLQFLAKYLEAHYNIESKHAKIDIHYNYDAQASLYDDKILITNANASCPGTENNYDRAIITTHANHALDLLRFRNANRQQQAEIAEILGSITYSTSIAVCHTWYGVLPLNRNLWRAYNVIIRQGTALKPYSMTYVCNRHQNDAENDKYNLFGSPQFFVTLNPQIAIPDNEILRKLPADKIPQSLLEQLPQETLHEAKLLQAKHQGDTDTLGDINQVEERAITYFNHNMIDKNCFLAQKKLVEYHNTQPILYFGGAWTYGSGLHEECWLQSNNIAQRLVNEWN
jgi:predicted NAD/FAD-binding protein